MEKYPFVWQQVLESKEVYNRGDQPDGIRYEKAEMNPEEAGHFFEFFLRWF